VGRRRRCGSRTPRRKAAPARAPGTGRLRGATFVEESARRRLDPDSPKRGRFLPRRAHWRQPTPACGAAPCSALGAGSRSQTPVFPTSHFYFRAEIRRPARMANDDAGGGIALPESTLPPGWGPRTARDMATCRRAAAGVSFGAAGRRVHADPECGTPETGPNQRRPMKLPRMPMTSRSSTQAPRSNLRVARMCRQQPFLSGLVGGTADRRDVPAA